LPFRDNGSRFVWDLPRSVEGVSERGVSEALSLDGPKSFYGTSKLASELLLQEYVYAYGMKGLINRCGIIAGPWQMGKVDQGVVTLWVRRHVDRSPLTYIGFGGEGKQVRDILHIDDLIELMRCQLASEQIWDGRMYNVGGGMDNATSLRELTVCCAELTGNELPIHSQPTTNAADVRIYVTDNGKVQSECAWRPRHSIADVVRNTYDWYCQHRHELPPA